MLFKDCSQNEEIENLNLYGINYKTTSGPPVFINDSIPINNTCIGCC